MFDTKEIIAPVELKADSGAEGKVSAVFSTFGAIDSDGDVVVREAFTDGQAAPMVWAHDWTKPIGKGSVRVESKRAVFDGELFLDTAAGLEAYRTMKRMGALQEYSWGFRVLEAEPGVVDGQPVRIIKGAELFEVSPVLIGSNRETYTLAIKDAKRRRLSRHQVEGAIAVLQALIADDESDDVTAATETSTESTTDDGAAKDDTAEETLSARIERLEVDVTAYAEAVAAATDDDAIETKDAAGALLRCLSDARAQTQRLLTKAEEGGSLNLKELRRQFVDLEARHRADTMGVCDVYVAR